MSRTSNLSLPLLAAAQAQKHVTMNAATQALDVLVQPAVIDSVLAAPPSDPADGDRYLVPAGAIDAWAGQDHKLACWQDGVWVFHAPQTGWRVFVELQGRMLTYLSGKWRPGAAFNMSGAATILDILSESHTVASAAFSDTALVIPERSILLGITCLVTEAVTGPSAFSVGVAADPMRFGNGIGVGLNSQMNGITNPYVYWADAPIRLSAASGSFTGGTVQVAAHILKLEIPDFV